FTVPHQRQSFHGVADRYRRASTPTSCFPRSARRSGRTLEGAACPRRIRIDGPVHGAEGPAPSMSAMRGHAYSCQGGPGGACPSKSGGGEGEPTANSRLPGPLPTLSPRANRCHAVDTIVGVVDRNRHCCEMIVLCFGIGFGLCHVRLGT